MAWLAVGADRLLPPQYLRVQLMSSRAIEGRYAWPLNAGHWWRRGMAEGGCLGLCYEGEKVSLYLPVAVVMI